MLDTILLSPKGAEGIIDQSYEFIPEAIMANHPKIQRPPHLPVLPLTEMKSGEGLCSTMAMDHSSSLM